VSFIIDSQAFFIFVHAIGAAFVDHAARIHQHDVLALYPQRIASSAQEMADAPAPEITRRISLCFFPTISSAFARPRMK
jgi:hypothetical protein